ncbi:stage IV sporulation protein A [Bacillus cereus]|uniref:stage IV sporulation protein A n=1 Tax=Bacillus cereus TaxID=1396 RepID=UPI00307A6582
MPKRTYIHQMLIRTKHSLKIGIVGPCRAGKSSLVKSLTEQLIIPNLDDDELLNEIPSQLPTIRSGREIATKETVYVPKECVEVDLIPEEKTLMQIIEFVGCRTHGMKGYANINDSNTNLAEKTNEKGLFEELFEGVLESLFEENNSVITEDDALTNEADIVFIVTSDGTIGTIPHRYAFVDAERTSLAQVKKPHIMLLNSSCPEDEKTKELASELNNMYKIPVIPVSVCDLTKEKIYYLLETMFYEFPYEEVDLDIPEWLIKLEETHPIRKEITGFFIETMKEFTSYSRLGKVMQKLCSSSFIDKVEVIDNNTEEGLLKLELTLSAALEKQYNSNSKKKQNKS